MFPHNQKWNIQGKIVLEYATNDLAEYLGALEAMKRANLEDKL